MAGRADGFAYRRGLVLGLTLAEIFLLLLFLLLLVFAHLLSVEESRWDPVRHVLRSAGMPASTPEELQAGVAQLAESREAYASVRDLLPDADAMVEAVAAFARLRDELAEGGVAVDDPDALTSRLQAMSDAEALAEAYSRTCGDIDALEELLASDFRPGTAEDALRRCPSETATAASSEPRSLEEASQMIARLRRTNAGLSRSLSDLSEGRGLVYPPCWASLLDTQRPHYLYNVTIDDDGLEVEEGDPRSSQDLSVFASGAVEPALGRRISQAEFLRDTKALFDWSVDNQCRFFVRVSDASSPSNKAGYKTRLATVENHFYKYLVP